MRELNTGKETQAPRIRDEFRGTTITLTTETAQRYEGDIAGVTLKDIDNWQSGPADAKILVLNGDCECGYQQEQVCERDLYKLGSHLLLQPLRLRQRRITRDQFAANEQMFGVTTSYDWEVYTTKLDRTAADYKEKERKAQRITSEILNQRRRMNVDDSGMNEEDKRVHRVSGPVLVF
ncbi:uncharacterized protein EDB91DRAFT_1245661 [Suillus paluster]|uniref:uncharacterized protein n=1 Tax=Suillus paluster TaxID=48578 RepID=UPI001B8712AB|nr:uncharacterized protein EDB91DRAFT_1245661 [Suillus paluster]KAG1747226.1 hypothetical protein EDB91DRAFT_1245661 [Suillus paluster]